MNKPLALLLALLGFPQTPPKNSRARYFRRLNRATGVLALLYLGLQMFPQVLFAHSVTADHITFYSRQPLPADITACAARARGLLQRSELASPEREEKVFLCDSPWLFSLLNPLAGQSFAYAVPWTDNVFIAQADVAANLAHSRAPIYNTRPLSAVVAHEITHGLILRRVGRLRGMFLPAWIKEGYCDYVTGTGSFPEATGRYLMASGRNDPSPSFRYFKDRQMVRYLLDEQHLSFAQLVTRANDAEAVEAQTRQWTRDHPQQ